MREVTFQDADADSAQVDNKRLRASEESNNKDKKAETVRRHLC